MEGMIGWQPFHLIVECVEECMAASEWVDKLATRLPVIRGIVEGEMSSADSLNEETECVYAAGDPVMFRRAGHHQKHLAPYERG